MGAIRLTFVVAEKPPVVWIDGCKSPRAIARKVLSETGAYTGNTVQVASNVGISPTVFEIGLRDLGIPLLRDNQYDATSLRKKKKPGK